MPRQPDPRVPQQVEEYLIGIYARAGSIGGSVGGRIGAGAPGASGGASGGARGGARGARRLATVVEERSGHVDLSEAEVRDRIMARLPGAEPLPADDVWRVTVPIGVTGLQRVVVDLVTSPENGGSHVLLRAFGKEGVITRHPTRRTATDLWAALTGA